MDITPFVPADKQVVQAYGDGGFRVSGRRWEGSVIVMPQATRGWEVAAAGEITFESLAPVVEAASEVQLLLVGCGPRMCVLPAPLRQQVRSAGIVVEAMDTGAACRTYNVLLAEGRQVAAALIAVE